VRAGSLDDSMQYGKGLRLRHPLVPDWGVGEVLEDSTADTVKIFFVGAGEKKLCLRELELEIVTGDDAKHPILDNLKISAEQRLKFRSLPESIRRFLSEFPAGFYDDKFTAQERDHKLHGHRFMTALLGKDQFKSLLDDKRYDEIYDRALKVVNLTNLIFPNEKTSLKNALDADGNKRRFSEVLYFHLFGDANLKRRFLQFCEFLDEIKAAKWTIATYFLFLTYPDRYMLVKPTVTDHAADICAFDIKYRSELNCATYKAVLRFSEFLRQALGNLKPRDMIDVQSFIGCIRPDKNPKSPTVS
jgi:hypothetical protein